MNDAVIQSGHGRKKNKINQKYVSPACIALICIIVLVLGVLYLIPDSVTKLLRPLFIGICMLVPSYGYYRLGNFKWLLILVFYYLMLFLVYPQTANSFTVCFSLITFALFFFFAGAKIWTAKEIGIVIKAVCFACAFEAVIVLISNPGLLGGSSSQHISYFSTTINRNSAAFSISPGVLCGMILMFYDKKNVGPMRFAFYTGITLACAFAVFSLGCRSAFSAMTFGAFLIAWQRCNVYRNVGKTAQLRIILVLFTIALIVASAHYSEGSYSERLFDFTGKMDDSGRHEIWEKTWGYIMENPVFGGGFDKFPSDLGMGTHNSFLTVMLYSGMVGGGLMALVIGSFLLESLLHCHSWIPAAFLIQTMMHSYTEPNFDYYAYIPIVLAVMILRYLEYQSADLKTLYKQY